MCYGISGTVDDKGVVRTQFTCSHDHKGNKPDENRRTYWEWETHYPFKQVVFTNIGEIQPNGSKLPKPDDELKRKVRKFIKDNRAKIALALLEQAEGKGMELMAKSKNGNLYFPESKNHDLNFWKSKNHNLDFQKSENNDLNFQESKNHNLDFRESENSDLNFWESRNNDLNFWESRNNDLNFWESRNGNLDFCWSKNGELCFFKATIGKGGDVRYLKTGWKKADRFIRKISKTQQYKDIPLGKMIELVYELGKKEVKPCATE